MQKNYSLIRFLIILLFSLNFSLITISILFQKTKFSYFLFQNYALICHQGNRLILWGKVINLPLCFRCIGIYSFLFFGCWIYILFVSKKGIKITFLFLSICTLPIILDGFLGISKLYDIKFLPFLTGSLFGFACSLCILQGIRKKP